MHLLRHGAVYVNMVFVCNSCCLTDVELQHCQRMVPEYSKAAQSLHPLIPAYAVDCDNDANKRLCADQVSMLSVLHCLKMLNILVACARLPYSKSVSSRKPRGVWFAHQLFRCFPEETKFHQWHMNQVIGLQLRSSSGLHYGYPTI